MKLSEGQKKALLDSLRFVYSSYLALDLFQHHDLALSGQTRPVGLIEKKPLVQHIFDLAETCSVYPATLSFFIGEKAYQLEINAIGPKQFQGMLIPTISSQLPYKPPSQYADTDIGILCANKRFILSKDDDNRCYVALALDSQHPIGGKSKMDLYRTHLLTLFNIMHKIEKEEDISNLLVALATGSGKTFVQALWLLVLTLAGFTGVFSLPDRLIPQFIRDMKRLLPDTLTQPISVIRDKSSAEHNTAALTQSAQQGSQIIASSTCLLDNHYPEINALLPEHSFFIFDEQHLLMNHERRRLRLLTLSQRFLSMFLTATPDEHTYLNSGSAPVAIMSSGQKQQSGQGQFPMLRPIQACTIADLHRQQETQGIMDYLGKILDKCLLLFDDAIQPECISTIHTLFDELPFLSEAKSDEPSLRWRLQVPIAKKMLCIIEDNDTIVNACDYVRQWKLGSVNGQLHRVYHDGNFVVRDGISGFFDLPDVARRVSSDHWDKKKQAYIQSFTAEEQVIVTPLLNRSLYQQLRLNMFHYLVEYVLSDLSGLSMIEHNALRKRSPEAFLDMIKKRSQLRSQAYYFNKLLQEIDADGAVLISPLLHYIFQSLERVMISRYSSIQDQLRWTDNWFLDDALLNDIRDYRFTFLFDQYIQRNSLIGVFSGLEEEEMPITDAQPFSGLNEDCYPLHSQQAKQRQRTSLELLDDTTQESTFTPNYLNISEAQADNYFRLGFMGMYVSNKKTEGFSDPNLHTVLNAVQHSHDFNNHPKKQIQAIGRDRGLDDTQWGHYIAAFGRDCSPGFDLKYLLQDDYYPELFAAEKNFDQKAIPVLGELVGKEIIDWYHKHQKDDESIDPEQLKRHVLRSVAKVLRKLNIQNTHNIHISRQQLPHVIGYAMQRLDKEIEHTKRAYQLSLFVRILGSILNIICECYFFIIGWKTRSAMREHSATLANVTTPLDDRNRADQIYLKIIQQTNYKTLVAQNLAAGELQVWLKRKTTVAQKILEQDMRVFLKPDIRNVLEAGLEDSVLPMFAKMLVPEKQTMLMEKMRHYSGLISLLQSNTELFAILRNAPTDEVFAKSLLTFLHRIPGLERLKVTDVVHYPARLRAHVAWMSSLSPTMLESEPELKEKVIQEYALFLSEPEFVQMLDGFMLADDQAIIANALQQDPARVRAFVTKWVDQQAQAHETAEPDALHQLIRHFELNDVKLLSDRGQEMKAAMAEYQMHSIAIQIQQEILPCLVNVYPLEHRKRLLQSVSVEAIEDSQDLRKTPLLGQ